MKIGILGGTFNPIHYGHLIIAEYIRVDQNLEKIIFIPTGIPPHKNKEEVLDGKIRGEMVALAIESNPKFECSTIEIYNEETSYTIDTIKSLKSQNPKDEFHMIIGGDSLMSLRTWKGYKELIGITNIIVGDRYCACGETIMREIDRLNCETKNTITSIKTPIIEISSTEIRNNLREKRSIKYLVPENVENFIQKRGLYINGKI